jgi:hypothetical protein
MIGFLLGRLLFRRSDDSTDPRALAFARGLALGALVGAALAGSGIWKRYRRERSEGGGGSGPAE